MTYLGNEEILKNHKIAFFCSQKCPAEVILKSFDWAIEQRNKGNCIVTGAHSPVEKDVFQFLIKGKQPLILVLGRNSKKPLDNALIKSIDSNRLIVIYPFDENCIRISQQISYNRNQYIAELADEIFVAYATPGGNIEKLLNDSTGKKICSFEV